MKCNDESEDDVRVIIATCHDILNDHTKHDLAISLDIITESIDTIAKKNNLSRNYTT